MSASSTWLTPLCNNRYIRQPVAKHNICTNANKNPGKGCDA